MSFAIGDLAITVSCRLAGNNGQLVRIKSAPSYECLAGDEQMQYVFEVEIATQHGWLAYERAGHLFASRSGPMPENCLQRPITTMHWDFIDAQPL